MDAQQEKALNEEAVATLDRLKRKNSELEGELDKARGFAVFPAIGRASLVLGGAYGHGVVFEKGKPIGFASLSQITIGVQIGGQTFSELIFFDDRESLETFKGGKVAFTANVSAALIKAAASGTTNISHCTAHAYTRGGMVLEFSLGGQKFTFIPPSGDEGRARGRDEARARDRDEDRGRERGGDGGWATRPLERVLSLGHSRREEEEKEEEDESRQQSPRAPALLATGLSTLALIARVVKAQAAEKRS